MLRDRMVWGQPRKQRAGTSLPQRIGQLQRPSGAAHSTLRIKVKGGVEGALPAAGRGQRGRETHLLVRWWIGNHTIGEGTRVPAVP